MRARVRPAVPLTDDERRTLSVKLAQAWVESGSVILDGSLEGQLNASATLTVPSV